jgi:hypothetical protein
MGQTSNIKCVEAGDARFDESDIDGSSSDLAAKPSLYFDGRGLTGVPQTDFHQGWPLRDLFGALPLIQKARLW